LADIDLAGTGVPSEDEYVANYVKRTGIAPSAPWGFYMGFALFRLAAILQGVLWRARNGQAGSPDSLERGALAGLCAEAGLAALKGTRPAFL
jgi:aminoglycoside phosphotransferase (APT) family kinase protein